MSAGKENSLGIRNTSNEEVFQGFVLFGGGVGVDF